jgi:hypothetical protein
LTHSAITALYNLSSLFFCSLSLSVMNFIHDSQTVYKV